MATILQAFSLHMEIVITTIIVMVLVIILIKHLEKIKPGAFTWKKKRKLKRSE